MRRYVHNPPDEVSRHPWPGSHRSTQPTLCIHGSTTTTTTVLTAGASHQGTAGREQEGTGRVAAASRLRSDYPLNQSIGRGQELAAVSHATSLAVSAEEMMTLSFPSSSSQTSVLRRSRSSVVGLGMSASSRAIDPSARGLSPAV